MAERTPVVIAVHAKFPLLVVNHFRSIFGCGITLLAFATTILIISEFFVVASKVLGVIFAILL